MPLMTDSVLTVDSMGLAGAAAGAAAAAAAFVEAVAFTGSAAWLGADTNATSAISAPAKTVRSIMVSLDVVDMYWTNGGQTGAAGCRKDTLFADSGCNELPQRRCV